MGEYTKDGLRHSKESGGGGTTVKTTVYINRDHYDWLYERARKRTGQANPRVLSYQLNEALDWFHRKVDQLERSDLSL